LSVQAVATRPAPREFKPGRRLLPPRTSGCALPRGEEPLNSVTRALPGSDAEGAFVGRHTELGAAAVDGAGGAVAVAAAARPAHDREVGLQTAVATGVGVEIETAVFRDAELDLTLVRLEPARAGEAGELDTDVSLVGVDPRRAIQVGHPGEALVGVELQVRLQTGDAGIRLVVL